MTDAFGKSEIDIGAAILRRGGLVAFPTETVYGLGADVTNPAAIARIFQAKGRPATNPLIVHVADEAMAMRYAAAWPPIARRLAERFWPGPLTLVVKKAGAIVDAVTAGGATVGLRVPNHPVALALLRAFAGPVAAPSANRSEHTSPTTAQHVRDDLGDRVDLILDGGPCQVGIESTVLDVTKDRPRLLRPGGITAAQIEAVIGPIEIGTTGTDKTRPAASPGQHTRHYAPRTPAFRFESVDRRTAFDRSKSENSAVLAFTAPDGQGYQMPADPRRYATDLYRVLRKIDSAGYTAIYIEMPPSEPEWLAVRDRLTRATAELLPGKPEEKKRTTD